MSKVFFIASVPRSASTAYAIMLNTATNAEVFVEQDPKLLIESRKLWDGGLEIDPHEVLKSQKEPEVNKTLEKGLIYGDKNPGSYVSFMPFLADHWPDCKIVYLVRDGRDVVRSMMDWHDMLYHNLFARNEDGNPAGFRKPEYDPWDYSRLRPLPGNPVFDEWKQLSRFEKASWHWANKNLMGFHQISKIDSKRVMVIDTTHAGVKRIEAIFEFLGLEGFNAERIGFMVKQRLGSVFQKWGWPDRFPRWPQWEKELVKAFDRFAGKVMEQLGYY